MKTSPPNRNRDFSRGIPFTQFLMPDGRIDFQWIDGLPEPIVEKAKAIVAAGYVFEIEMLRDYKTVRMTISDDLQDYDQHTVENGPEVPETVAWMIENFRIGETGETEEIR